MRIAFTSTGPGWDSKMNPGFGRTEYFIVYDDDTNEFSAFDNSDSSNESHGAGPKTAQRFLELHAEILITGNGPGGNASAVLEKTETKIYVGAGNMLVQEAYIAYKNNELNEFTGSVNN